MTQNGFPPNSIQRALAVKTRSGAGTRCFIVHPHGLFLARKIIVANKKAVTLTLLNLMNAFMGGISKH